MIRYHYTNQVGVTVDCPADNWHDAARKLAMIVHHYEPGHRVEEGPHAVAYVTEGGAVASTYDTGAGEF